MAVVGLYTGGHGGILATWPTKELVLRHVGLLEFAFGQCRLAAFLDAWEDDRPGSPFDPPDVSFLWPQDRSWFFRAEPDSSFVTFSGSEAVTALLLEDSTVETWIGSPDGPAGAHTPYESR